jgi:enoyl-CoA hydratase/3-hydroxyacyl-CoA dehydrogenase
MGMVGQPADRPMNVLGVVGAGNMGSGIAQKMATEGFAVVLVDLNEAKVERGLAAIESTLAEGVTRRIFKAERAAGIFGRIRGATSYDALAEADLVVEAVFEDLGVKKAVFAGLDRACRSDAILATNTSSFSVAELAAATVHRERVLGLHYFYHPAKNRLVEVVAGPETHERHFRRAWALQEALGKTPIRSRDAKGFVVNRFFSPWLNEAVRLLEEGVADVATIDAAAREAFGIGMGPFELMNVTGVPIALHTADTLGAAFGPLYAAPDRLRRQSESGAPWGLSGEPDASKLGVVADRLQGVVFYVAAALVDEGVGTMEEADLGARVGLRWRRGPFELMNHVGVLRSAALATEFAARFKVPVGEALTTQARTGAPFVLRLVTVEVADGIATLTIQRPDAMNALDEAVVAQLRAAFAAAEVDPAVRGIVIAGRGKAFIAGADIRFFIRNIESHRLDLTMQFTKATQDLLRTFERCRKPVVARLSGLALGGGVELALACHHIVATPRATLGFPETGIGIYPGLGGTQRTPRRVGVGLAKWLVLSGTTVSAAEAAAMGLVDRVVEPEGLDAAVAEAVAAGVVENRRPSAVPEELRPLARFFESHDVEAIRQGRAEAGDDARVAAAMRRVASKAPIALRLASDLIDRSATVSLEEGLALELQKVEEVFATRDAYAGLSSLGGKPPGFEGK